MQIEVIRNRRLKTCTIGEMYIDGEFFCYTLEDVVRESKIKHETAIPAGKYRVIINYSVRFRKLMPLLLDVPNFGGIRIHAGNTHLNTSGCILVGFVVSSEKILESRKAYDELYQRMRAVQAEMEIWITIREDF